MIDSGCSHRASRCLEVEKYRREGILINPVAGGETEEDEIQGRGQMLKVYFLNG